MGVRNLTCTERLLPADITHIVQSLIYLSDEVTLFNGELGALPMHAHPTLALVFGHELHIEIELGSENARQRIQSRCMLINVAVMHRINFANAPALVIYPEPGSNLWQLFRACLQALEAPAATGVRLVHDTSIIDPLVRQLRKSSPTCADVTQGLHALKLALESRHPLCSGGLVDERVARVIAHLQREDKDMDEAAGHTRLAHLVDLSVSRLTHLFKQETGVTLRLYQQWVKLRMAARMLQDRMHITHAAHDGGFADAAHFANAFKRTFGVTPSDIFRTKPSPKLMWCSQCPPALHNR